MSDWIGLTEISLEGYGSKPVAPAGRHKMKIKSMDIEVKGLDRQVVISMENDSNVCKEWLIVHTGNYKSDDEKDRAQKRLNRGLGRIMSIQNILGAGDKKNIQPVDFFIGKEIGVEVYDDHYNGKTSTKIRNFMETSKLAQDFSAPPTTASPAKPLDDDEIPF